MKTFLINLDRNKDRLDVADRQLADLGISYERFPAVSGRDLTAEERSRHVARFHARMARLDKLTPGEVGCTLSHMFIFKKMIDESIPVALIFEDDLELSDKFPYALKKVESELEVDAPQVYLFTGRQDENVRDIANPDFRIVAVASALRADAYVITLPAAKAIWAANYPVVTMNDWWGRWRKRGLIELYRVLPTSSTQRQMEFVSDVTPNKRAPLQGLKWILWKVVRIPCVIIDWLYWWILKR